MAADGGFDGGTLKLMVAIPLAASSGAVALGSTVALPLVAKPDGSIQEVFSDDGDAVPAHLALVQLCTAVM